jgi:uncharacterized protein
MAALSNEPTVGMAAPTQPWWRFGIVWFAFGLPACVVVAALFTTGLAVRHADPLVLESRAVHGPAAEDVVEHGHVAATMEPAERARNHASMSGR